MIAKEHITRDKKIILSICDKELIGKEFSEGKRWLFVDVKFYGGEEKSGKDILKLVEKAYILNIVGEESVRFALKEKLIDKKSVVRICNIPQAQCVIIKED